MATEARNGLFRFVRGLPSRPNTPALHGSNFPLAAMSSRLRLFRKSFSRFNEQVQLLSVAMV